MTTHTRSTTILMFGGLLALPFLAISAHAQTTNQSQFQATPETRAKVYKVARACKADIKQYCKGIEYGGGRIASCLKTNEAAISDGCRTAMIEAMVR